METPRQLRKKISQILIRWNMPTRQVAINEIIELFYETLRHPQKLKNRVKQRPNRK